MVRFWADLEGRLGCLGFRCEGSSFSSVKELSGGLVVSEASSIVVDDEMCILVVFCVDKAGLVACGAKQSTA